jgi:hypothetical protein
METEAAAIGLSAARQMNSLLEDKQTRTAAQKKISSKLIYTSRMLQGLPAAQGVPSLETGVDVDDEANVLVDITADVTNRFVTQLQEQGASIYASFPSSKSVRAMVPASRLETIASWPDVVFIRPRQEARPLCVRLRRSGMPHGRGRWSSRDDRRECAITWNRWRDQSGKWRPTVPRPGKAARRLKAI